jgi:hypothetical protein
MKAGPSIVRSGNTSARGLDQALPVRLSTPASDPLRIIATLDHVPNLERTLIAGIATPSQSLSALPMTVIERTSHARLQELRGRRGPGERVRRGAAGQGEQVDQVVSNPKTGQALDVYIVESSCTGSVGPAAARYNDVLATQAQDFAVAPGAVFLDTKLTWDDFANELDLSLPRRRPHLDGRRQLAGHPGALAERARRRGTRRAAGPCLARGDPRVDQHAPELQADGAAVLPDSLSIPRAFHFGSSASSFASCSSSVFNIHVSGGCSEARNCAAASRCPLPKRAST